MAASKIADYFCCVSGGLKFCGYFSSVSKDLVVTVMAEFSKIIIKQSISYCVSEL